MTNSIPNIIFDSETEARQWEDALIENIKISCRNIFINDNFEYTHAEHQGLTERQRIHIINSIEHALKDIFPDSGQWCYEQAGNIVHSVTELSETLIEYNLWPNIYTSRSKEQIFDLFIGHAIRKLENDVLSEVMEYPYDE